MGNWKHTLQQAFEAPPPEGKRAFLRKLNPPGMSLYAFLFSQIGYIKKGSWWTAAMVFAVSAGGSALVPGHVLWLISGLTPLLALTILSESGLSQRHQMAELEMATRFSLRSILLARLAILGLANLVMLVFLCLLGVKSRITAPLAAALYIVTPFLLSVFIGLSIVRKDRTPQAIYACAGACAGISLSLFLLRSNLPVLFQERWLAAWGIAALVLLIGNGKQCIAMIKQTEELAWSLS